MSGAGINEQLDNLRKRVERLEAASSINDLQEVTSCSCDELVTRGAAKIRVNAAGEDVQEITEYSGAVSGVTRGCATVDWSRNDNGFLRCVDGVCRRTSNLTVRSHSSTATAFGNLRGGLEGFSTIVGHGAPGVGFSTIVGHGAPGVIICGTGQIVSGVEKYIAASNETVWRTIASRGIAGTQLTLFGCEVAAGDKGADLLRRVATAVRRPVGAWTGLVWCNGTRARVWGTGSFVVARPGLAVDVVESPTMYSYREKEPMKVLRLASHQGFEEVAVSQVRAARFTPIGGLPETKQVFAEQKDAAALLNAIDFENPFVTEDVPGSIIVGMLTVTSESEDGEQHVRAFRVLSTSLVQDVIFQDTYYYVSKEFQSIIAR